jgi:hypothetical protein
VRESLLTSTGRLAEVYDLLRAAARRATARRAAETQATGAPPDAGAINDVAARSPLLED